jgi:hypothetical protein
MSQTTEFRSSTALVITLPERVFTRSGSSFDPREDVWEWTDGPFNARIDFRRYTGAFEAFVLWLKHALLPFVKGHSSSHVTNLNQAFFHFTDSMQTCPEGAIGAQHISNYAAKLGAAAKMGRPRSSRCRGGVRHVLAGAAEARQQEGRSGQDAESSRWTFERGGVHRTVLGG